MTFGGAPCPSEFAVVADLIADTINNLLTDTVWNHMKIYFYKVQIIPDPISLSDNISPMHNPEI